ncbi:General transcription factor IIH polypeptide 3 [Intoshia linei]|uniref:General transcription factor IIH subunit 3 n=1 Tax=Intoshia linei TaxID=1819745 RepID=A0A177B268_9BILA|nr:General transcription factor IIH polypeptide 3 [Intoshia linei]
MISIIVDSSVIFNDKQSRPLLFLDSILLFASIKNTCNEFSVISVYLNHNSICHLVYENFTMNKNDYKITESFNIQNVCKKMKACVAKLNLVGINRHFEYIQVLGKIFCKINSLKKRANYYNQCEIIIISMSNGVPKDIVSLIMCAHTANKLDTTINVYNLNQDCDYLKEICNKSLGKYYKTNRYNNLYYELLWLYGPKSIKNPIIQTKNHMAATCFCHSKIIDIGFVCSTCLSIYCSFQPICSKCCSRIVLTKPVNKFN